jgi:hypothetical protein
MFIRLSSDWHRNLNGFPKFSTPSPKRISPANLATSRLPKADPVRCRRNKRPRHRRRFISGASQRSFASLNSQAFS